MRTGASDGGDNGGVKQSGHYRAAAGKWRRCVALLGRFLRPRWKQSDFNAGGGLSGLEYARTAGVLRRLPATSDCDDERRDAVSRTWTSSQSVRKARITSGKHANAKGRRLALAVRIAADPLRREIIGRPAAAYQHSFDHWNANVFALAGRYNHLLYLIARGERPAAPALRR